MEVDTYPRLRPYVLFSGVPGDVNSLRSIAYGLYIHNTDSLSEGSKKVCFVSNLINDFYSLFFSAFGCTFS